MVDVFFVQQLCREGVFKTGPLNCGEVFLYMLLNYAFFLLGGFLEL